MKKIIGLFLLMVLGGCAQYKVTTRVDPTTDLTHYNSWCWMNDCNPTFDGPDYIFPKRVMEDLVNAIAEEMQYKGYVQQDDQSDLLIDFRVVLKEDSTLSAVVHEEALPMWEQYESGSPYYHYLDGTLIIDIADRAKGHVVWRSVTKSYLPKHPDMNYDEIKKGIKRALKDFPKRGDHAK